MIARILISISVILSVISLTISIKTRRYFNELRDIVQKGFKIISENNLAVYNCLQSLGVACKITPVNVKKENNDET